MELIKVNAFISLFPKSSFPRTQQVGSMQSTNKHAMTPHPGQSDDPQQLL